MTTGVRRSGKKVVFDRRGRRCHSVHSGCTGNNYGEGVAGYPICSNTHIQSRVNASHGESRLVSMDASAALFSGYALSDSASIADHGIHGEVGASNPHGRWARADAGASLLSGSAIGTIPVHDVSGMAATAGVTGNKESVVSGHKPRGRREEERVMRQRECGVRSETPGKEKKSG